MKNKPENNTISSQKLDTPIKYVKNITKAKNGQNNRVIHTKKRINTSAEFNNFFSPQKFVYGTKVAPGNLFSPRLKNRYTNNIAYIYETPEFENGNLYGEKINEKKNYILYCSELPLNKDKKDNQFINIDKSPFKYATKANFYEKENIRNENYNYKEIKAFKDSHPEIKSVIQHQVYNAPLELSSRRPVNRKSVTYKNLYSNIDNIDLNDNKNNDVNIDKNLDNKNNNKNLNNGNKRIFGSFSRQKMRPSFSTKGKFKNNRQFVFEKKRAINNKVLSNKELLPENSDYSKILIRKLPHVMSENNLTNNVKTYTKSTKNCDYIIKVTTTYTEVPNNDPVQVQQVQMNKRSSQIFDASEKCQICNKKKFGSIERISNNNKYVIEKNGDERKRIACCPVHGKKKFIYN